MFIDTHCHLFKEYYDDISKELDVIRKNGVNIIINNACDKESIAEVILSTKNDGVYAAIGYHPDSVNSYDLNYLESNLNIPKIVAIGEIGLDYHYGKENRDEQIYLFESQLKLAEKYNLPVIVHSRDATEDTLNSIKKYKVRGIIHSFSGSYETAMQYISLGFLLGVNGVVTFKNCNLKDVLRRVSLNDLVLETDSPYLTPVPYRGQKNSPRYIPHIAEFIANLYNISIKEVELVTSKNVMSVFDITL